MIRKLLICLLTLLLLCPLFTAALGESALPDEKWICLCCGSETSGTACSVCHAVHGVWICYGCGTRNFSVSCSSCGKSRDDSLQEQAFCGDPLRAWPAVRYLASLRHGDALCALAAYYESGFMLGKNNDAALACCMIAADSAGDPGSILGSERSPEE